MEKSNFQYQTGEILRPIFGPEVMQDLTERQYRFLEEAIELVQSLGFDRVSIFEVVDYVYSKEDGEPMQELGGTMVTLAALSNCINLNMLVCGEQELFRLNTPEMIKKVREKQTAKPKHVKNTK